MRRLLINTALNPVAKRKLCFRLLRDLFKVLCLHYFQTISTVSHTIYFKGLKFNIVKWNWSCKTGSSVCELSTRISQLDTCLRIENLKWNKRLNSLMHLFYFIYKCTYAILSIEYIKSRRKQQSPNCFRILTEDSILQDFNVKTFDWVGSGEQQFLFLLP